MVVLFAVDGERAEPLVNGHDFKGVYVDVRRQGGCPVDDLRDVVGQDWLGAS